MPGSKQRSEKWLVVCGSCARQRGRVRWESVQWSMQARCQVYFYLEVIGADEKQVQSCRRIVRCTAEPCALPCLLQTLLISRNQTDGERRRHSWLSRLSTQPTVSKLSLNPLCSVDSSGFPVTGTPPRSPPTSGRVVRPALIPSGSRTRSPHGLDAGHG